MILFRPTPALLVVNGPYDELNAWREQRKLQVPGARFTPQYKRGHWDGCRRLGTLKRKNGGRANFICTRGLLPVVLDELDPEVRPLGYEPAPALPVGRVPEYVPPEMLRDYQAEGLVLLNDARWGRLAMATNAGKGLIMVLAAVLARDAGLRTIILADEISVFEALEGELEKWTDAAPGKVEGGVKEPPEGEVVLAMVPTLYRRVKDDAPGWRAWLGEFGMALLDEADKAGADSWQAVMRRLENTHYRVGFSGSFYTNDQLKEWQQYECMGPVLERTVKNKELIERGISARPLVELHQFRQQVERPPARTWFNWTGPERRRYAYEEGVVRNERRHQYIEGLLGDVQNAVVVDRIEHGELLAEYLPDAIFLSGSDSKGERREVLEAFKRGDFQNLVVTKILDRGTNLLGHAVGLVFASGAGSPTQTLQRIGRGLRRGGGKEFVYLKDVVDVPPRGYDPDRIKVDPYQYFVNSAKKRMRLYNNEEFDVTIVDQ